MSGLDERVVEEESGMCCIECQGTSFAEVRYGYYVDNAVIEKDGSVYYDKGVFQGTDSDTWQCRNCYETATFEVIKRIRKQKIKDGN
jgi:hypothetical protein